MADYYIDPAAADDTGTGLSELDPWKTVAKVNGETF